MRKTGLAPERFSVASGIETAEEGIEAGERRTDRQRRPPRTLVAQLGVTPGRVVRVCGWAVTDPTTPSGSAVADHTGTVALLGPETTPPRGSAIDVVGAVVEDGSTGGRAMVVQSLEVAGPSEPEAPLGGAATLEERLDWRYLDLRRAPARLVFEVQTTLEKAMRKVWDAHGFVELHTPKLMATGPRPEELFALDYFDGRAWLAQSPQFYKQMAMAAGLERVFEIGPVFRAEAALDGRHATEFTSVDVEMAWIDSEADVMAFAEEWICYTVAAVADRHGEQIAQSGRGPVAALRAPFPRVTLAEAWEIAQRCGHPGGEGDLDPDAERSLGDAIADQHGSEMVWVTDYPAPLRPFYHMASSEGSPLTRSFDLLWKGLEVASGAQREHRHDRLVAQARSRERALGPIGHYLDFFRFGCPPHGGFGFGLNRLLMCLLGYDDLREVTLLPRDRIRLSP
ncbi:MAG TPA: aspartate--tRNA(Asn) ligase [Acidimicrobiales bacterium]|nr:aspartate--tRNA(Asn) ligase [Acidimicrobiales bacterium]